MGHKKLLVKNQTYMQNFNNYSTINWLVFEKTSASKPIVSNLFENLSIIPKKFNHFNRDAGVVVGNRFENSIMWLR
jgi:hypothetical protein